MICAVSALTPPAPLKRPSLDPILHYPDMAPLRQALMTEDWASVVAYFDGLPAVHDPSVAVRAVALMPTVEVFLRRTAGGAAGSPLAGTLLGARLVAMAWAARGSLRSEYTTRAQFARFHQMLEQAESVLSEVTAEQPDNVAAWTDRVRIARGLQMGLSEARRRYEQAAKARPHPFLAQMTFAQQLCPKWGGTLDLLHAFARQCAAEAPEGALNAAIVADAHLEHELAGGGPRYFRNPEVLAELQQAVARSVGHPSYEPVHGWVLAQNTFVAALLWTKDAKTTAARLQALGNRVSESPWNRGEHTLSAFRWAKLRTRLRGGWR
jgi:hypothetical protein